MSATSLATAMPDKRKRALRFVLLVGAMSLFADFTYEGARGIAGPFLGALGASGAVVGIASGLGEFLGYALRIVSGRLADKTRNSTRDPRSWSRSRRTSRSRRRGFRDAS